MRLQGRGERARRRVRRLLLLFFQDALQHTEGFIQEVGGATHRRLKLLHGFTPLPLSLEFLETPMLFVEDGLFGIEQQTVQRVHAHLPIPCELARYQSRLFDGNSTKAWVVALLSFTFELTDL